MRSFRSDIVRSILGSLMALRRQSSSLREEAELLGSFSDHRLTIKARVV